MKSQSFHLLIFLIVIDVLLKKASSQNCITPDISTANISDFASNDYTLTLMVQGSNLNQSYCVDVLNWPISNDTLYNWSNIEQGSLHIITRNIFFFNIMFSNTFLK